MSTGIDLSHLSKPPFEQTELEASDGSSGLVLRTYRDGAQWAFPWKQDEEMRVVPIECDCEGSPHGVHWVDVQRLTDGDLSGRSIKGYRYEGEVPKELVERYA
jgi:hypothetical protein